MISNHESPSSSLLVPLSSSSRNRIALLSTSDVLEQILSYVGTGQYRFVAMISRQFQTAYLQLFVRSITTYRNVSTVGHAKICFDERTTTSILREYNESILCRDAANCGNLPVLQYLRSVHCAWDTRTCQYAALKGHLSVLQWARSNNCGWDEWTCTYAAHSGHLNVLQWARANDCPWDEDTCFQAAFNGHLSVLQWARANGCPWNEDRILLVCTGGVEEWVRNCRTKREYGT